MISVPGLGSGLDISSIVSQLVAVEGDAKTILLADKQSGIQSEITAFGSLKSLLSTFQTSTAKLKTASTFDASLATSSNPDIFTASTSGAVEPGSFDIEVRQLAEAHKLLSAGYTDADTIVGEGTLTINVGSDSFDVVIDSSNSSVAGIRNAINQATDNTGVSATVINVDDGSGTATLAKLVLRSDNSGSESAISITVDDDDGIDTDATGLSALYYDPDDAVNPEQMSEINPALAAEVYIDGQRVLSQSNTVVNAIDGVTLNLLQEDSGTNHTLTIAQDRDSIAGSIDLFVSNYNSFVSLANNLSAFNSDTGSAGIFLGDATLRTLRNQVRSEISNAVEGLNGPYSMLVDIGITTNSDGTLSVDSTQLTSALDTNFDDVAQLFSSTNGLAVKLDGVLNEYTKSGGIIDGKTQGLNSTIEDIADEFEDLNLKLESLEERLLAQFSALDVLLTQLNSTSNFLTEQFEILGGFFESR